MNFLLQVVTFRGRETVWDFATREKMTFDVFGNFSTNEIFDQPVGTTGLCTTLIGANVDPYFAYIWGFEPTPDYVDQRTYRAIEEEYKGTFVVGQVSAGVPLELANVGGSVVAFSSVVDNTIIPNGKISGYAASFPGVSAGLGLEEVLVVGISALALNYIPDTGTYKKFPNLEAMTQDLKTSAPPLIGIQASNVLMSHYPE